ELPGAEVVAVCDAEPRHRLRALGSAEKAKGSRPVGCERIGQVLERQDLDAVAIALPCDLHGNAYRDAIRAGKHLYAEKPLALTMGQCDSLIAEAAEAPDRVIHVGFQRRSNPRHREGVELVRRGELGTLIEARGAWISSKGPVDGHVRWL